MAAGKQNPGGTDHVLNLAGRPWRERAPLPKIVRFSVILSASLLLFAAPAPASPSTSKDKPVVSAREVPNRKSHLRRQSPARRPRPRSTKPVVRERVDSDGWMGSTDRREERLLRDLARFRTGDREETVDLNR